MQSLSKIQQEADLLPESERAELATHLLSSISNTFLGADDREVDRREQEMDAGLVSEIPHEAFIRQVGRK